MSRAVNHQRSQRAAATRGRATWITPSNASYYKSLVEDCESGETLWSISKHACCGDRVLLYICAPVMAIVATATLTADPQLLDAPENEWHETYMAEMGGLRLLETPIPRSLMMQTFPAWRYWIQPHKSSRVRDEFVPGLDGLLAPSGEQIAAARSVGLREETSAQF